MTRLSARVNYQAREAAGLLNPDKMLAEIQKQTTEGAYWVDETDLLKALTTLIQRGAASWENNIAVVLIKTSKAKINGLKSVDTAIKTMPGR